jgi:hypothetical protein
VPVTVGDTSFTLRYIGWRVQRNPVPRGLRSRPWECRWRWA